MSRRGAENAEEEITGEWVFPQVQWSSAQQLAGLKKLQARRLRSQRRMTRSVTEISEQVRNDNNASSYK